jgi:hypothetical protein
MCNSLDNLDNIKRSIKNDEKAIKLAKHIKLVSELGEPAENFRIIDERPMTPELIDEFELAIKSGIAGRPPKVKKVYVKPQTIGDKYMIMWKYNLRDGITGAKLIETSRDFCVNLIEANRFYTRQDINSLSNGFGLSVFRFAGGYYHNPETGETTPFCRHNWVQTFVERIK